MTRISLGLSRFWQGVIFCLAVTFSLLLFVLVFPDSDDDKDRSFMSRAVGLIRKERLPLDTKELMTAGYYEDLFKHSSRAIATNRLVMGQWATNWRRWKALHLNTYNRRVNNFLYYKLEPNLNISEYGGRLITNSLGMADQEYSIDRPAGIRRIVLIGDSIARGMGATHGKNFEALLELELNRFHRESGVDGYEILNLAVGGYRITQMLYVLDILAPRFSPQVYIVAFSNVSIFRKWGDHIGQLVHDGIDLHYPWLKELVRRADLRPDDDPITLDAKLAPYRLETLNNVLDNMAKSARKQGAGLIVILVPSVGDYTSILQSFEGIEELILRLDIPVINLLDTFAGLENLEPYRVSTYNQHPTEAGHRLIFYKLFERLKANPQAWNLFTGH
jgi:hypothetical protein